MDTIMKPILYKQTKDPSLSRPVEPGIQYLGAVASRNYDFFRMTASNQSGENTTCFNFGCDKPIFCKKYCRTCYARKYRFDRAQNKDTRFCSTGCGRFSRYRGLCQQCISHVPVIKRKRVDKNAAGPVYIPERLCTTPKCNKSVYVHKLCKSCYEKEYRRKRKEISKTNQSLVK